MIDCIEWVGARDRDGYGRTTFEGKRMKAHRVAFFKARGWWPPVVRHKCDNPPCVNEEHLLGGTNADNMRDKVERGRSAKGELQHTARLTEAQVFEIRAMYASGGWSWPRLAERFDVSLYACWAAGTGRTWKHLD